MKTVFVIQSIVLFKKIDFNLIFQPKKYRLILILFGTDSIPAQDYIVKQYGRNPFFETFFLKDMSFMPIKKIISRFVNFHNVKNMIVVTNSEPAVPLCGRLNKLFKIGSDDLLRYSDKIIMKNLLKESIKMPKYVAFNDDLYFKSGSIYINSIIKQINFPLFVKPINQNSSIGTTILKNKSELILWSKNKDNHFQYEIDELINGKLFHCDSFIKNGKILHTIISEYLYPCYEFILGKAIGSITLSHRSPLFSKLKQFNQKALIKLGLPNSGMTHLEVFQRHNGELVFLEVAARAAGCHVPISYQRHIGVAIREAHLLLQIDKNFKPNCRFKAYTAWISFPKKQGIVKSLCIPKIISPYTLDWEISPGDQLVRPESISDIAGTIVMWNKNYSKLRKDFEYFRQFNAFKLV